MMREELQDMRQMEEVFTGDLEEQVLPEVIEENGLLTWRRTAVIILI